ncbi:hypothetical protein RCO28_21525 [Streptomyces sp. LHD-70]|uniref:hypothetical protein n=1 Tax=Streptomyces sp. LHD-70 TaxID=3072140 RepID=UPI00280CA0F5|nr:hypothetical protein [Streptomyces sp. LHD-70]MDQ8705053.1 hypothetical protein [Streptomyces sp. LHD-70]
MPHRSTNGADGRGELTVPMAWLYAEYIADELLRTGDLMPPTSFEYRAGRDSLALTIFLSDVERELSGIRVVSQLETWLSLTAYDRAWEEWVGDRMATLEAEARESGGRDADLDLARAAWRWLEETELLAPDLDAALLEGDGRDEEDGPQVWTPAWQLGLPLGHLAIHLF